MNLQLLDNGGLHFGYLLYPESLPPHDSIVPLGKEGNMSTSIHNGPLTVLDSY